MEKVKTCKEFFHNDKCPLFKDKSHFIVLPCKAGDAVYKSFGKKIYEIRAVVIPILISNSCSHLSVTATNYRDSALTIELMGDKKTNAYEGLTERCAIIIHAFDVLTDAMSQAPHGRRLLKLCRHRKKRIRKKNLHRLARLTAMLVNYWSSKGE